jgi:hypothetical protein
MFNRIHWICLSNCPQITTTINVELIFCFIGNLDIFLLISTSNFDSIDELTRILKIIGQCIGAVVVVIVWKLDLQLPVQSVPFTTKVVSSNPVQGEVYSIQHYVIK